MKDQININIQDGEPFFAHEVSINFTPTQVTFDFKCITPRTDPRSQEPSFQIKHNVVMLDPWHAKSLLEVLGNVTGKYEKEFGKIQKPKSLLKAEKKQKELAAADPTIKGVQNIPNYMG